MLRVAMYLPSLFDFKRGRARFILNVCKYLSKYCRIYVLAGKKGRIKGARVFSYPYLKRTKIDAPYEQLYNIESATFLLNVAKHFETHDYDIVHVHFPYDVLVRTLTNAKLLLHCHGWYLDPWKWLLKRVRADAYASCSKFTASFLRKIVKRDVHVIYAGVDSKQFKPKKIERKKVILYLGALSKEKRVDLLVKAFKYVERRKKSWELWIGGRGNEEKNLRELVKKLRLRRVRFLGYVPERDLVKIYSSASVFVLPSPAESFGIVVLEAMACETPVIVSDRGGPKEIITPSCGLSFRANSVKDLAKHLLQLDELDLHSMGKAARRRALSFTWEKTAKSLYSLYRSLV